MPFYGGVASARAGDGTRTVANRADSALYASIPNGPGSVAIHNGRKIDLAAHASPPMGLPVVSY